ncbi:protein EXECUTER 1, chloroplastic [Typha angustifolia]|uniref:protein EXECUTER 1, chloroplastic n=1 Tax=Typha angustifolia TaxID=59011 RepID=UPI003C2AD48C
MASLPSPRISFPSSSSHSDPNPKVFPSRTPRFLSNPSRSSLRRYKRAPPRRSRGSDRLLCLCRNTNSSDDDSGRRRWDFLLGDVVQGAVKKWGDYVSAYWNSAPKNVPVPVAVDNEEEEEQEEAVCEMEEVEMKEGVLEEVEGNWSWDRWKRHFGEIEESERLVYALKSQLRAAVAREDYDDAEELKLAIVTAEKYDAVGKAISDMNRAVDEERYSDAASIRDSAGTGLVGWWAGVSENPADPYGQIVRISAEYGRFVAKSYSSRQITSCSPGIPLFEIYLTETNGEYKQQAVYMKPDNKESGEFWKISKGKYDVGGTSPSDSSLEGKAETYNGDANSDDERDDDVDLTAGLAGLENLSPDMVPIIKVKVLKVVSTGKVDKDFISKIIDQILEEDGDDNSVELESKELDDIGSENNIEETEIDAGQEASDASEDESEFPIKISVGAITEEDGSPKNLVPVPARLERRDRLSFSLYVEQDDKNKEAGGTELLAKKNDSLRSVPRAADLLIPDLAKVIGRKNKISVRILNRDGRFSSKRARQALSAVTHFSRIVIPATSDPLSGLYVAASGFDSEVLYLKRKFGQWQEDDASQKNMNLEFYEYVEAIKVTGDHLVPAGQVVYRAKIGKQYQLPHKGIIPKEFGVVARYRGQGRLAEPGSENPRWVDGDLLILDGKHIRDGPVVAFFYWGPNFHLFEFYNRLRLPD